MRRSALNLLITACGQVLLFRYKVSSSILKMYLCFLVTYDAFISKWEGGNYQLWIYKYKLGAFTFWEIPSNMGLIRRLVIVLFFFAHNKYF